VARFVYEMCEEGSLILQSEGNIKKTLLYRLYQEWCRRSFDKPLGIRRFQNRISTLFPDDIRESGSDWVGIHHNVHLAPVQTYLG